MVTWSPIQERLRSMNEKKKKWSNRRNELSMCSWNWRVLDDQIVAGSLFRDAGPATANAWSPKLVFECGTWR